MIEVEAAEQKDAGRARGNFCGLWVARRLPASARKGRHQQYERGEPAQNDAAVGFKVDAPGMPENPLFDDIVKM